MTLRVAIACSGLGHVRRGIETWAEDLATALTRLGVDVRLFGGGQGAGQRVACLRRSGRAARTASATARNFGGWRYGFGSAYEVEQLTFALNLLRRVRTGYDILHVQDPLIARCLDMAHANGLSKARVILANGTEEATAKLAKLTHLQELTPTAAVAWQARERRPRTIHAIPNFVDTSVFSPGDRTAARSALGLPRDGEMVLCCAAIRAVHKRIDWLIDEFAVATAEQPNPPFLVIAGAREDEADAIMAAGHARLGGRVKFLVDFPRASMPELYRAADVFVLPSLHEAFGIVLLEAMASGLPVICHDNAVFRYVTGPAALRADLSTRGGLVAAFQAIAPVRAHLAEQARAHVQAQFSQAAVAERIVDMYSAVVADG